MSTPHPPLEYTPNAWIPTRTPFVSPVAPPVVYGGNHNAVEFAHISGNASGLWGVLIYAMIVLTIIITGIRSRKK